jgi:hypothetical protein
MPASRRIVQTVLAASLTPSPTSSLWIRRYPHPGFSRANRSTSSRTATGVPGRPGRRYAYVQRRATSSRCQRRTVAGLTKNEDHAERGSARLKAASSARSTVPSCGRATWRSSTCNWWRSTRISISFARCERIRSTASSSSRRSIQYRNDNTTPRERPTSTTEPTDSAIHHRQQPPRPNNGDGVSGTHTQSTCAGSRRSSSRPAPRAYTEGTGLEPEPLA